MSIPYQSRFRHTIVNIAPIVTGLFLALAMAAPARSQENGRITLPGHVPQAVWFSTSLGSVPASQPMNLAIALPLRNTDALGNLISRLYDPSDPMYGQYLSPAEFTAQFAPTQADYDAVIAYCKAHGLTVAGTHSNRLLLDVNGSAEAVQSAFGVHLETFLDYQGHVFFAPEEDPSVPADIAGRINAIVGLDNVLVLGTHAAALSPQSVGMMGVFPKGTGVGGALSPTDIRTAYSMSDVPETGTGQTMGLFELAGYSTTDITDYEHTYQLPAVTVTNELVDGVSGAPSGGGGQFEVTMDIELQMALDPGISSILVYEGPNDGSGILDTYSRIATDNLAKTVSTSWGAAENKGEGGFYSAESSIFQEMAVQGQSIFAASGDSGAYDNGSTLSVDDPASQPFVTGCGGTTLTTSSSGLWESETTWCDPSDTSESSFGAGGGGGVSVMWTQPSWQSGVGVSSTMRNVPDVVLDADPYSGYSIVAGGQWYYGGGTSAAAPLWAAFTALVNQRRLGNGSSYLGLANPELYAVGKSPLYSTTFHDINNGSNNLYYTATTGYDDATGWGSFIGDGLISALASSTSVAVVAPKAPTGLAGTPGNDQVTLNWSAPTGASTYNVERATSGFSAYSVIATGVANPTYTDTGLTNGHIYYYKVQATNSAGNSPYTSDVTATPMPPIPAAPANLVATPGNASVALSWTASPNATSYLIRRALVSGGPYASLVTVTGTSYTNTGLTNYHTYYYEVCASNMSGTGAASASVSAMPRLPIPAAPAGLKATLSGTHVVLRWTASTYAASYNIERSQTNGGPYTVIKTGQTTQPYTDTTTAASTTYYYVIVAVNQTGSSGISNQASAVVPSSTVGTGTGSGSPGTPPTKTGWGWGVW